MPVCNLADLPGLLRPGAPLLGLDPGRVTLGVALSDPARRVAMPLKPLKRSRFEADVAALGALVRERGVGGLVIGLPRQMDGTEGPAAQSARSLASNLLRRGGAEFVALPMAFWDERFSTAAVTRAMLEDDATRRRRAAAVDSAAAAWILQGALDALGGMGGAGG